MAKTLVTYYTRTGNTQLVAEAIFEALPGDKTIKPVDARPRRAAGAIPAFVELPGPMLAAPSECLIECENAAGSKMRIHLKGGQAADLVALSVSFWGAQP